MGAGSSRNDRLERARASHTQADYASGDLPFTLLYTSIKQNNTPWNAQNDDSHVVDQLEQRLNPSAPAFADVSKLSETAPTNRAPKLPEIRNPPAPTFADVVKLPGTAPTYREPDHLEPSCRTPDSVFDCPTCAQWFGLTIYVCKEGHSVCKECKDNDRTCGSENGSCGAPITGMRNIALEAFVAENCENRLTKCENDSCTMQVNFRDMHKHRKECPFGVIDCPVGKFYGKCAFTCKVPDLESHFDSCHKQQCNVEVNKETFILMSMYFQKLFLIKNGPYNFVLHIKICDKDHMVYMAVQLIGTAESASEWTYQVHVYNKSEPHTIHKYAYKCHAMSTPLKHIFNEKNCVAIPIEMTTIFVNEGAIAFKLFITKTGEIRT